MPTFFTRTLKPLILALILSAGINYVYAGWVAPNAAPPAGNINTPINTGSTAQSKTGPFTAGWNGSVYGLNVTSAGKVGIATTTPSRALVVNGDSQASRFCIGNNCINSWPSSIPANITFTGGNLNVGTTSNSYNICVNGTCTSNFSSVASDWTSAGGTDIENTNTGNVGIGGVPGSYKLDLYGNLNVRGSGTGGLIMAKTLQDPQTFTANGNSYNGYIQPGGNSQINNMTVQGNIYGSSGTSGLLSAFYGGKNGSCTPPFSANSGAARILTDGTVQARSWRSGWYDTGYQTAPLNEVPMTKFTLTGKSYTIPSSFDWEKTFSTPSGNESIYVNLGGMIVLDPSGRTCTVAW